APGGARGGRVFADNATYLRHGLEAQGFAIGGDTHILPILLGDNARTVAFAAGLRRRGRVRGPPPPPPPPRFPPAPARPRATPTPPHPRAHLDRALDAFAAVARELGA